MEDMFVRCERLICNKDSNMGSSAFTAWARIKPKGCFHYDLHVFRFFSSILGWPFAKLKCFFVQLQDIRYQELNEAV